MLLSSVEAAYLQKAGVKTAVLERRHVLGGAAVTEEIIPGFKFSRASYLLSLLRPQIYRDLELKKHGLKIYFRNTYSYTPLLEDSVMGKPPRSLTLGINKSENLEQISQFSKRDAKVYLEYEALLDHFVNSIDPLIDSIPVDTAALTQGSLIKRIRALKTLKPIMKTGLHLGQYIPHFYEIITAPAAKILHRWFESEPLKATLATDAVIGAMISPQTPGSGYVLLHHVMGELEGHRAAWGYVEGGMGSVSMSIAKAAASHGASIFTEKPVDHILVGNNGKTNGVVLQDGTEVRSKLVLSNATAKVTFLQLTPQDALPDDFIRGISKIDYTSPVTKINVAVDRLPNFLATPQKEGTKSLPHHQTSIHLNCEDISVIDKAYEDASSGIPSERPMIEMCIPSALDPTIAPSGCHVISMFTQYTPYALADGRKWDDKERNDYADRVFECVEQYAPGFKASVIGRDILTPPDLERIFGLTGGNIFHGAMSLDQLFLVRPLPSYANYRSPIKGLYLCGSGAHPGGGVMGSAGRNAALVAFADLKTL
ncbi:pyridine nucleotide-disulfide oxidoreductase domain-containing protein 2 isoform X2 [Protopterus annectens]|uniref:pyridine nucleotide-disulfide oxidoreductase domain-containing protein 2 isoform X2 n=1 Tax=Protopterus annectens TaxID=7888 RepID=UPI001CFAA7EC|nr:pyridine nucleotide-disulfide oxidoreductase domain-containing protein 2 isoform X2 [Protopterus annectens]